MKVLIIPEDPTHDQYILKPIVEQIFAELGRKVRVEVLQDPHLGSIDQALDGKVLREVIDDNPMVDLFLLLVDHDCDRKKNSSRAKAREAEHLGRLIACLAVEEVEVWMLALHRDQPGDWKAVRQDCDPRERYAVPFLERQGWELEVGRGRKRAMRELGQGWNGLLQVCPELQNLRERIRGWLASKRTPPS